MGEAADFGARIVERDADAGAQAYGHEHVIVGADLYFAYANRNPAVGQTLQNNRSRVATAR